MNELVYEYNSTLYKMRKGPLDTRFLTRKISLSPSYWKALR